MAAPAMDAADSICRNEDSNRSSGRAVDQEQLRLFHSFPISYLFQELAIL